jgi:ketosteroid isomerase-like protein
VFVTQLPGAEGWVPVRCYGGDEGGPPRFLHTAAGSPSARGSVGAMRSQRETVQEYFRCVDAGDVEALLAVFADDAVYERPGYPPLEGIARIRAFYEGERVIDHGAHDVEGIVVEGDHAAAWGSFRGVSRAGAALEERWSDVYRFADGRIVYRRSHFFRPAV